MKGNTVLTKITESINILSAFCGKRDIDALTQNHLRAAFGFEQADVMALFGGSILAGTDVLAEAMKNAVAKTYVIVGGEGHTTQTLRDAVHALYPDFRTDGLSEAEIFSGVLLRRHGLSPDFLECASTNCGNNITNLLSLLQQKNISANRFILTQDASMQRRMEAGLRKHAPDAQIVSYAAYETRVVVRENAPAFDRNIPGMWQIDRYISLLLGEIPRLTDDENGYGPRGKNYIAHVDIPDDVRAAFDFLAAIHPALVREANPLYAG